MQEAVEAGLIQILYISRESIRAGQFLSLLADRLTALSACRVVLDAATEMLTDHMAMDEFRHVLYKLVVRFKTLGITSFMTLEAPSLSSTERVTEIGLSPIADNLFMLRYDHTERRLTPTLTIVKTRGSDHDRRTHTVTVVRGGMRVGPLASRMPEDNQGRAE